MQDEYGSNGHRFEMRPESQERGDRRYQGGYRDDRSDDGNGYRNDDRGQSSHGSQGYARPYEHDSRRHRDDHGGGDHRGTRQERERDEYEPRMLGNSLASVWEVTAQSRHSFDDAIRYGIDRARRSLRHIRGAWVQGQEVLLRSGEIYAYRVQLKVTYVLDDR
jgi:flavin-binding protein dodecin